MVKKLEKFAVANAVRSPVAANWSGIATTAVTAKPMRRTLRTTGS